MASSSAAGDDSSNGSGSGTGAAWDRVVWFRRPDTGEWWPAERYPSHASLLRCGFHFGGMQPVEQSLRLTRTYVHRECLGADRHPVPVARLLGVPGPPAFWAVEEPGEQLGGHGDEDGGEGDDFLTFLVRRVGAATGEIPRHLEEAVEEAARILLSPEGADGPTRAAALAAAPRQQGGTTTAAAAAADTRQENNNNNSDDNSAATVAASSQSSSAFKAAATAAAASTASTPTPAAPVQPQPQQAPAPQPPSQEPASAPARGGTTHPERSDRAATNSSSNRNKNSTDPTETQKATEKDDTVDADDDHQKLAAAAAAPPPPQQDDDNDFVVGNNNSNNDPIDPIEDDGLFDNDDDDDDDLMDDEEEETPVEISNSDSWEAVLAKLRDAGWVERCGLDPRDPLRPVYYRIGAGGKGPGCREGIDYFTAEQLRAKIGREYGWNGPPHTRRRVTLSVRGGAAAARTPPKQRTHPQDPGKPLEQDWDDDDDEYCEEDDDDDARSLASSHVDATKEEDPIRAVAVGGQSGRKRRKLSKRMPRKQILTSGRKSRRGGVAAAAAQKQIKKPTLPQQKKSSSRNKRSVAWWKEECVPSFQSVWPILFKIGFSKHSTSDGKFLLPKGTPGLQGLVAPKFSNAGLRKFLCKYGIPCYNKTSSQLSEKEREQLHRWIVFANVPVQSDNSVEMLSEVAPYEKDKDIISDLISFGFETASGIYFPNYKEIRHKDKPGWDMGEGISGVHYLPNNELWTSVRAYIRGAWTFEPPIGRNGTDYDELVTPSEGLSEGARETYLRLHLFGATSTAPLPEFTEQSLCIATRRAGEIVSREELLKPLQAIPTEVEAKRGVKRKKKSASIVVPDDHSSIVKPTARAAGTMVTETKGKKTKPQRQRTTDPHWWKHVPVPSFQQIWPILEKIGFFQNDAEKFMLPKDAPLGNLKPPVFESRSGLRKFLCAFGIPCYDATRSRLDGKEEELIRRWATFANVPVHNGNSIERLTGISHPEKFDDIVKILFKFGFSTRDGRLYFPDYTLIGDRYTARYHSMHGVHYLKSKDVDLLRVYVRHAWRFGLLIDHEEAQEDSDRFETPTKYMNTKLQKLHLEVRLWAAASSMPLPIFSADALPILTKNCDGIFVEAEKRVGPFERMPDIEEQWDEDAKSSSDDESSSSDDSSVASTPSDDDCAPGSPVSANDKPVDSSDDESVHSAASQDSSIASVDMHHFGDKEWYKKCPGPDFRTEVWSILQKFGFTYKTSSGQYFHPDASKAIGDPQDVQKFCARRGIPNMDSVECTEQEKEILHRWASFAYVDVKPSKSVAILSKVEDLSGKPNKRQELLEKLGFQFFDGKIYPPGSDDLDDARSGSRKHKVHYYIGDEIRDFIRSRESFSLVEEESHQGRHGATVSTEEMLSIRLWAALSPNPLPTFEQQPENSEEQQKQSGSSKTRAGCSTNVFGAVTENGSESQPLRESDGKSAEEEVRSERHQETNLADGKHTNESSAKKAAPKQPQQQKAATETEKAVAQEEPCGDNLESEDTLETGDVAMAEEEATNEPVVATQNHADSGGSSNKMASVTDDVLAGKEASATTEAEKDDPMQHHKSEAVAKRGAAKELVQTLQNQADSEESPNKPVFSTTSASGKNGGATTEVATADPMEDSETPVSAGKFESPATHGSSDSEFFDAKQSTDSGARSDAKEKTFPATFLDQNKANNGDHSFLLTQAEDLYDSDGEEADEGAEQCAFALPAVPESKQMTVGKTHHVESVLLVKTCEKDDIDADSNKERPIRSADGAVDEGSTKKEEEAVEMDCESESDAAKKPAAVDRPLVAGPKENNDNNMDTDLAGSSSAISSVDRPRFSSRAAHPGRPQSLPSSPSGSVSSMVSRGSLNPSVLATLDETIFPKSVGGSKRKRAAIDAVGESSSSSNKMQRSGLALDSLQQFSEQSTDAGNSNQHKAVTDQIFASNDEDVQSTASSIEGDDDDDDFYDDHNAPLSQWDD